MSDNTAVTAESATAPEVEFEHPAFATEKPAEVAAEPAPAAEEKAAEAPATEEKEATPEEKPSETNDKTDSEPVKEKELGEKGRHELIRTRKRAQEAEIEAARLRGQLEAVEKFGLKPPAPKMEQTEPQEAPKPEDFENTADFVQAVSAYSVKKAMLEIEAANVRKAQQAEQIKAAEKAATVRNKMIEAGKQEFGDDFEDAVINNPDLRITPAMAATIYESEVGHLVSIHLAKNPEESARIADMTPAKQIRELVALESKIMAARQPKTTTTPPPIKPIKGGSANSTALHELTDMDAYAAARSGKKG